MFGGGTEVNYGKYILDYMKQNGFTMTLFNGIDANDIKGFVDKYFMTQSTNYNAIKNAIDSGYIIMASMYISTEYNGVLPNVQPMLNYHNILIVGYDSSRNYVYMDPEYGYLCTQSNDRIQLSQYFIIIKGRK